MINLLLWLLLGALVGWLASIVMHTDYEQGPLLNIVVGIVGALIGGLLFGYPTINQGVFNLPALLVSFVGAVILLAIVNLNLAWYRAVAWHGHNVERAPLAQHQGRRIIKSTPNPTTLCPKCAKNIAKRAAAYE